MGVVLVTRSWSGRTRFSKTVTTSPLPVADGLPAHRRGETRLHGRPFGRRSNRDRQSLAVLVRLIGRRRLTSDRGTEDL